MNNTPITAQQRGFFMVANDIVNHHLPQLGIVGFFVYCLLRRMADRQGRCYPSLNTLTRMTGLDKVQVEAQISHLEEMQLMSRIQQTNSYNGKPTEVYVLPLFPTVLDRGDAESPQGQAIEPGAQLSLHLDPTLLVQSMERSEGAPIQPTKAEDPPREGEIKNLISLMTLLVEQMRETTTQTSSLITRMDQVMGQLSE